MLFLAQRYAALLQKWQAVIVFLSKDRRPSKCESQGFPYGSNSFKLCQVTTKYQNSERFLWTINSQSEMIHCCCFVMAYLLPVNMNYLTFEYFRQ